jgi:UDP-4-amino-4,6-dideoxy-N-acetyl-beta-L-altrosamine transaminase
MIPYARQSISDEDIAAVVEVLRSEYLTQGPAIERFEEAVAARCGARAAVAVSSATAGLHLACLAAGLGPGDRLWTTPNTFVASANCGLYCGAEVDFVDIDPATGNLSVGALDEKLRAAAIAGRLPRVVVAVDFAGQPCELHAIGHLAQRYGFAVVEDASHAVGARYRGQAIGDGRLADLTVFSFHPVKIVTTGEGGMVLTNRTDWAERVRRLRTHGITRDSALWEQESPGPWYYEQLELGYHYRMTDLQAALGLSQWSRLDAFLARRRELAARYDRLLAGLPVSLPWQQPEVESAWHLYVVRLKEGLQATHRQVFEGLRSRGIGVNLHYLPVHLQPHYRRLGFREGDFPLAEQHARQAISLPMFAGLSDGEQDQVVGALGEMLR